MIKGLYSSDTNLEYAIETAQQAVDRVELQNAFVSYSQHGEDVLINRVFRDLKFGRFVDIGSNHPKVKSVTYALYKRGWRGICIDIDPSFQSLYEQMRPEDVFICAAISDRKAQVKAHIAPLSTRSTLKTEVSIEYQNTPYKLNEIDVECITLMDVFCNHQEFLDDCCVLNIDVEGAEAEVLRGIDFKVFRPEVIIIEAIQPIDKSPTLHTWDYILFENGYALAQFDGLNGYFVENKCIEKLKALTLPTNYNDDFITNEFYLLAKSFLKNLQSRINS